MPIAQPKKKTTAEDNLKHFSYSGSQPTRATIHFTTTEDYDNIANRLIITRQLTFVFTSTAGSLTPRFHGSSRENK